MLDVELRLNGLKLNALRLNGLKQNVLRQGVLRLRKPKSKKGQFRRADLFWEISGIWYPHS